MRKIYTLKNLTRKILVILVALITGHISVSSAQTVSTFENLILSPNSYWDGSDMAGGFASGNAYFKNYYTGFWSSGFIYSNKTDVTTVVYTNQYSAFTGSGYNASGNYAIANANAYGPTILDLTGAAEGSTINGFYVTNTTYAALSMKDGDAYGKKFGGVSGNDADWFKLSIIGFSGGIPKIDSVHFYLADFRFANNSQDYILNTWNWVDLTSLGNIDSLSFFLSSSDVGMYGMNTPSYFAMDNFNGAIPLGINQNIPDKSFAIYPNPANNVINIDLSNLNAAKIEIRIADIAGREVYSNTTVFNNMLQIPVSELQNGVYTITIQSDDNYSHQMFIKQ